MRIEDEYIILKDITLHAFHGVYPEERQQGTDYTINIRCKTNFDKAISSDSIDDTVSYALLYEAVKEEMALPSNLIEHVAGRIGKRILEEGKGRIESVWIRLEKKNPPGCCDAAVELTCRISRPL